MAVGVGEFLTGVLSDLGQLIGVGLSNPDTTADTPDQTVIALEDIWGTFGAAVYAIGWVMNQVRGAKAYEQPLARHIGDQIAFAEAMLQNSINHTTFTILPESLKYLHGLIYEQWILPQLQWDQRAEAQIRYLFKWVGQIWDWRIKRVDPELRKLDIFWRDFYKYDQPAINVLIDWLRHPAHFGRWAAEPITPWLLGYWSHKRGKAYRDFLTWIVGLGAEEQPDLIADIAVNILKQAVV